MAQNTIDSSLTRETLVAKDWYLWRTYKIRTDDTTTSLSLVNGRAWTKLYQNWTSNRNYPIFFHNMQLNFKTANPPLSLLLVILTCIARLVSLLLPNMTTVP